MLEALTEAIEELDIPLDLSGLAEAIALRDRLEARIALAAGEVDEAALHVFDGEGSLTAWLKANARMTGGAAARLTKLGRRMRSHPVTAEAWRDGRLSSGQVEVIEQSVQQYAVDLFAEHEPEVVPDLEPLSMIDTARAMDDWAKRAEAVLPHKRRNDDRVNVAVSRLPDGGFLRGILDDECYGLAAAALRVAMTKDPDGDELRSFGRRRHDALADILKFYLDNQSDREAGSHRPHVNVIATHDDLAAGRGGWTSDGASIGGVTLSTYLCDCSVHRVLVDAVSGKIDYGRETKTISARLRTVLIARDQGCRYPGCDRPATYCDGHHVKWWSRGGETNVDNLVLLCRRHHRTLHKPGWHAKLLADATLEITDPQCRTRISRPPGYVGRT